MVAAHHQCNMAARYDGAMAMSHQSSFDEDMKDLGISSRPVPTV